MKNVLISLSAAALALSPQHAIAQAADFVIVNATGLSMTQLTVRRSGTNDWQPLVITPVPVAPQARGSAKFKNVDCAFDLRATLPNGEMVMWPDVNLCQVKVVTLNRNARGEVWADYQ
jgi:hypothetical protein